MCKELYVVYYLIRVLASLTSLVTLDKIKTTYKYAYTFMNIYVECGRGYRPC